MELENAAIDVIDDYGHLFLQGATHATASWLV